MTKSVSTYTANHLARPAVEPQSDFSLSIRLYNEYEQIVDFRMQGVAVLGLDERPPLGRGWGPTPAHLLGSALGACLAGALLRCVREAGGDVADMRTEVSGKFRNDTLGQPHLTSLSVRLAPVFAKEEDRSLLPTPERIAERSLIADCLRPHSGLHVVVAPEVRNGGHTTARDVVRLVKRSPQLGNGHATHADATLR
jgi:uncharacterized OsmC-like protein